MMNRLEHEAERDHHALLRALLEWSAPEDRRLFLVRMRRAEREERLSWRALKLCVVVAVTCFLGWWVVESANLAAVEEAAVLVVDIFQGASTFAALVLSLVLGCWLWNRGALNRTEREGARLVLGLIESRTAVPRS